VIPVVAAAEAVYVTVAAPWQRVELAPDVNTGVPTTPFVVAVCVEFFGPLQPAALAVIVEDPVHPAV
jgi:hypothetical protein